MARTAEGRRLTALHRRQQLALRATVVREVARLWPLWRPSRPESWQAFEDAMVLLVGARGQQSAALAARYCELFRLADAPRAAIAGAVRLAAPPAEEAIRVAVGVTGRASVLQALASGRRYEEAMQVGLVRLSGAASRLVLEAGRETVLQEVERDPQALGWARVTGASPCAFCAMLAGRGPVYSEQTVGFQAHDHCSCEPEPVYEGAEWPPHAREWERLWTGDLASFRELLAERARGGK